MESVKIQNYINGEWVDASTGSYVDNYNPATGQLSAPIPDSVAADVDNAVQAAKAAFPGWSGQSAASRAAILHRIADLIDESTATLASFESQDQGKTVQSATTIDIPMCAGYFRQFAEYIVEGIKETESQFDTNTVTQHVASGVAALITPWNFPMLMVCEKLAPCIAVGNTCVIKPTELTSVTPYLLTHILHAAGVPKGVVNVVFGTGINAGEPLVKHRDVRLVSFTGGSATGAKVGAMAGGLFKRVSLELGGKNPSLIFSDCDFDHAVATSIRGAYQNQGEICVCSSRVYVQRDLYDAFVDRFRQKVRSEIIVGNPSSPTTFYGPVISQQHVEKVTGYI
ncbi:ALDH-like protein, partial [Martensiomyces pterosporus]